MNLYHLTARYQQLLDQESYTDAEMAELESLHADAEDHVIDRGKYIKNLMAERDAVKVAIEEMEDRAADLDKRIASREQELANYMALHNLEKVTKSPLFPIKRVVNPVSVDDYDKANIPAEYWKITERVEIKKAIDKKLIKQAIEEGQDVPGARLIRKVQVKFK